MVVVSRVDDFVLNVSIVVSSVSCSWLAGSCIITSSLIGGGVEDADVDDAVVEDEDLVLLVLLFSGAACLATFSLRRALVRYRLSCRLMTLSIDSSNLFSRSCASLFPLVTNDRSVSRMSCPLPSSVR